MAEAVWLGVVVAALLLVRLWFYRRRAAPREPELPRILVDGSNVMFWHDEEPKLETVSRVVQDLRARGFKPGVIFDASVGYKLIGRYQDDAELALLLGLPADQVLVVPKGTIADDYLLRAARSLKARIVTNDHYRDWAERFPEVRKPGHLVKGGVSRAGRLQLEI